MITEQNIYNFWANYSLSNIKPNRLGEFPEGIDMRNFYKELFSKKKYGKVIDIGCGYGRLSKAFDPNNYIGLDYSAAAIEKAKTQNSEYNYRVFKQRDKIPPGDTALLHTVCLHISDDTIENFLSSLPTKMIIITEVLGKNWRRSGNPPVFNRELEDYINILGRPIKNISIDYKAYKNTVLSVLVFEK
jgi:SAM-dependent methyltransferase